MIDELKYNFESNKLRNKILEFINIPQNQKEKTLIKKELEQKELNFLHSKDFYRNKIYFSKEPNCIDYLDLEIVFCNGNKELLDIWNYFKIMTTSAITNDKNFGSIKYMLKDKITNTYLGVVELSNDIYSCGPRDKYIGWTSEIKKKKITILNNLKKSLISFMINITCCVGLQPMSYNLNIGKLLVASVFSYEVQNYFYQLRGYKCACVTTFGLYGKSIQYDRMKEIKYIGETKGNGTCSIPNDLYQELIEFMKLYHPLIYQKTSKMTSPKLRNIQYCLNILNIEQSQLLFHGQKRGIYLGYTSEQSQDFLNNKVETFNFNYIKNFSEIFEWWKNRWAIKRLNHLFNNNRFKIKFELKDFNQFEKKKEYNKQYQYDKMNDKDFIKNKKEKAQIYYQLHKNELLEIAKNELINHNKENYYINDNYLGGFFDADGSIYVHNNTIFINFCQCVLNVLLSIQEVYGGNIYLTKSTNINCRNYYSLKINGTKCIEILKILNKTSILKAEKIKLSLDFLNNFNENKIEIINNLSSIKKEDNTEYFNRINIEYLAGFFDGDGSIYLNYSKLNKNKLDIKLSIVQKYTPKFLLKINIFLKEILKVHVSLCEDRIYIQNAEGILNFYKLTEKYLIVKKYQYSLMIEIIDHYKNKNINKVKELSKELKNNKHENIDYDIDIEKRNLIESIKINIKNKQKDLNNKIENQEINIEKLRLNKTGINNNNYGKELSENHKNLISINSTITKRKKNPNLTNEKIKEIYNLKNILLQKDVAEKYNMNREMIRRIWNKNILPTDDENFNKLKEEKKINNIETNIINHSYLTSIGKRTLQTNQYIEIILWKMKKINNEFINGKKISSTNLSKYLTEKMNTKISVDIIKNIWSGKTKLFESDFNNIEKINYNDYLELIKK